MTRKRSISSVIHEESTTSQPNTEPNSRSRSKVSCFCSKCNGSLVDPRTKRLHVLNEQNNCPVQEDIELPQPNVENEQHGETLITLAALEQNLNQNRQNIEENRKTANDFTCLDSNSALLPRKHRYTNRQTLPVELPTAEHNDTATETSEFNTEDDDNLSSETEQDYAENFEDYTSPDYELFKDLTVSESTNDK